MGRADRAALSCIRLGDAMTRRLAAILAATTILGAGAQAQAAEIQIDGPIGPLSGELIDLPNAQDVVVIIPGSGPIDRDGNGPEIGMHSDLYRQLAEGLALEGIASIRIDKRGMFGSQDAIVDPNDIIVANYALDMRDWVARAGHVAPCVWLAGHSEGGLVALLAAQDPPEALCGVILLATPGRPVGQLMIAQLERNPMTAGAIGDIRAIVTRLEQGESPEYDEIPATLRPLFPGHLHRYMSDLFAHDPARIAGDWPGPALIMQGDHDVQVGVEDAELLAQALPQAEHHLIEGATHMLKQDVPGQPFVTYSNPELPLHPGILPVMVRFIQDNHR